MNGKRIQKYWSDEIDSIAIRYKRFEAFIPSSSTLGSAHKEDDGKFEEELIRIYLKKYLPKGIEVFISSIFRLVVKKGSIGKERKKESHKHSTQLDIINYPILQRVGYGVLVLLERVQDIISVKKHLYRADIKKEYQILHNTTSLCNIPYSDISNEEKFRCLFTSLRSKIRGNKEKKLKWIFSEIEKVHTRKNELIFERLINYIGALDDLSILKKRQKGKLKNTEHIVVVIKK